MCPRGDETIIEILRMKTAAVAEQSAPAVTKGQRQDMHEPAAMPGRRKRN